MCQGNASVLRSKALVARVDLFSSKSMSRVDDGFSKFTANFD